MNKQDHPLYKTWREMLCRCESTWKHNYKYYGGRGIKVCERWHDLDSFAADMGDRPKGFTLDRIDQDGNYEPGNCRWADGYTQMNNRGKFNRVLEVDGVKRTMSEWSRIWHVPVGTIWGGNVMGLSR